MWASFWCFWPTVPHTVWPLGLRWEIVGACAVSFCWLRLSVPERDLVFQDCELVLVPGGLRTALGSLRTALE